MYLPIFWRKFFCLLLCSLLTGCMSDDGIAEEDLVEVWVKMGKMEQSVEKHAQKGCMGYFVRFVAAFAKLGSLGCLENNEILNT